MVPFQGKSKKASLGSAFGRGERGEGERNCREGVVTAGEEKSFGVLESRVFPAAEAAAEAAATKVGLAGKQAEKAGSWLVSWTRTRRPARPRRDWAELSCAGRAWGGL